MQGKKKPVNDSVSNSTTEYDGYLLEVENIRNRFRISRKATKKDVEEMPQFKVGQVVIYDPQPQTSLDAFRLLTDYYAACQCEIQKVVTIVKIYHAIKR